MKFRIDNCYKEGGLFLLMANRPCYIRSRKTFISLSRFFGCSRRCRRCDERLPLEFHQLKSFLFPFYSRNYLGTEAPCGSSKSDRHPVKEDLKRSFPRYIRKVESTPYQNIFLITFHRVPFLSANIMCASFC